MHRLLGLLICVLSCGCGNQSARAPMLTLKIEGENGASHSIGRFRRFNTGILSESGDSSSNGQGVRQRIIVKEIADNGVTLTFELSDDFGEGFTREVFVDYEKETKVELSNKSTLIASLKAIE